MPATTTKTIGSSSSRFGISDDNQETATIELNYHQSGTKDSDCGMEHSPATFSGRRQLQQQQQKHPAKINNNMLQQQTNDAINTISGSIPATGFNSPTITSKTIRNSCQRNNNNLGSDMNISIANSVTDLNNLNLLPSSAVANMPIGINYNQNPNYYQQSQYHENLSTISASSSEKKGSYFLWIMTPVAASISVAIVIAALAGPQWLYTEEKLPNADYNGTANFNAQDDGAFITKYTKSSLWILCTTLQGVETYNCIKIDYFPKEGYQPDPHDSTQAIPYTVTKSCPFFLASGILLLISFLVFLVPTCSHQNNLFYFSSGIMFIVSGLLMLIGLITYISILKAEIGSKLRPRSTLQPALFKVIYGHSFFLFVFGFIATEFVGVLNIFLYISLQEVGYYSKIPCLLSFTNVQEKIKEGERMKTYHPAKQYTSRRYSHRRRHYSTVSELELDSRNFIQNIPDFKCKKHPMKATAVASSSLFLPNNLNKRYYFEKPRQQKCDLHSKNLTKSLNELYTEPAPTIAPPEANLLTSRHHLLPFDMPKEFPLTRSVSTTTDLHTASSDGNYSEASGLNVQTTTTAAAAEAAVTKGVGAKVSPLLVAKKQNNSIAVDFDEKRVRKNQGTSTTSTISTTAKQAKFVSEKVAVTTATRDEADGEAEHSRRAGVGFHDICGLSRGIRKTKDELFNEFCKRAGARPKPKDIYYIEDENRHGDDSNDLEGDDNDHIEGNANIYFVDNESRQRFSPQYDLERNSLFVEPSRMLRKMKSEKFYRKSLFDLDRYDPEIRNNNFTDQQYFAKGDNGRILWAKQEYDSQPMYQSQTLPRSFMKRNFESQENIDPDYRSCGQSNLPAGKFQLARQQQQEPDKAFGHSGGGAYLSPIEMHKSCDDVSFLQRQQQLIRNPDAIYSSKHNNNYQTIAAGAAAPTTTTTNFMPIQWPAAIPTSPSNFSAKSFMFTGAQGNLIPTALTVNHHHKFNHGYPAAINDRRRIIPTPLCDAFDLDKIERDRRRSHASLFEDGCYDLINGTAV